MHHVNLEESTEIQNNGLGIIDGCRSTLVDEKQDKICKNRWIGMETRLLTVATSIAPYHFHLMIASVYGDVTHTKWKANKTKHETK